jgi:uncharacterized protein YecE (DUF72 family)
MTDPPSPEPLPVTADFAYVRWHGRTGPGYEYGEKELVEWAGVLESLQADRVHGYFNNDQGGAATRNATALSSLLSRRAVINRAI